MFKVGDWVRNKHTCEVCLCKKIDVDEFFSNENKWHIITSYSIWQPKEGEWCWFHKEGELPTIAKFSIKSNEHTFIGFISVENINFPTCYKPIMVLTSKVEPFIGRLPSFLKENR